MENNPKPKPDKSTQQIPQWVLAMQAGKIVENHSASCQAHMDHEEKSRFFSTRCFLLLSQIQQYIEEILGQQSRK